LGDRSEPRPIGAGVFHSNFGTGVVTAIDGTKRRLAPGRADHLQGHAIPVVR
jgi:hypothetical protein